MKNSELIAELQKHDPEALIVTDGYEGGIDEMTRVIPVEVVLDYNADNYGGDVWGLHELSDWVGYRGLREPNMADLKVVPALYLPRRGKGEL